MPIKMNCPSCGKTLTAPDTAAGKKAKCPACAAMMTVPTGVFDAEEIGPGSPEPAPSPPEFNIMDDIQGTAPSQSPADPAISGQEPARRPCPMCGEQIIAAAAKCRFCGAVFDPRLRGASSMQRGQSYQGFAITSMVLGILGLVTCYCGPVFGIPAIIFAVVASNGMKKSKNFEGKGMGTAGLILGTIGVVIWPLIDIAVIIFTVSAGRGGPRHF